jgi:hypothetical protein
VRSSVAALRVRLVDRAEENRRTRGPLAEKRTDGRWAKRERAEIV